jgi:5'-nucleotidase
MRTTKTISLAAAACACALALPAVALDIALTNDDGWSATGIQVMKEALEAAGHSVTLAAPLTDQSGASMALDMEQLTVKKQAPHVYSVALKSNPTIGAKPGSSGLVAIGIVQESGHSPDLLISGINTSANLGMATMLSGTVAAASHAVASVMNGPVPALAVGTDEPTCDADCKRAHYQVVADFIVRFVAHLETKPGFLEREAGLLPAGVGLVISYPASDTIRGVRIAAHSNAVLLHGQRFTGAYMCTPPGCSGLVDGATKTAVIMAAEDLTPEVRNADIDFYKDGYVTIVPVSPDLNVDNPLLYKSVLNGFKP